VSISPVPLSELGRLTGRFYLGESRPLIAMNCYFDGSVGGQLDQWLTLGGFVATDPTWARFQKQWEAMLKDRYPIAPYIHMTDIITGNDPFERRAGWTDCKVDRLISNAEGVLNSADKKTMCAFACSIDVTARKRLVAEGYKISDPAVICAEIGLGHLLTWYRNTHGPERAHLFYDQNEPFIRSIRRRWLIFNGKKSLPNAFWESIANVQPVRMQDTPAIQAADMVAWAVTRRLRDVPDDKWARLANSLIETRKYSGILPTTQLDPIDESMMRAKYNKGR
jgi:uncharacterized protein DUF3800